MASGHAKLIAYLETAEAFAKLSTCVRAKVGAVLVYDNRPIAVGYNGTVSGRSNVCEVKLTHFNSGDGSRSESSMVTKDEVVHAEMNVIAFAARHGMTTEGASMVTTLSPCFQCAKLMIQAGIKTVYYGEAYNDLRGVQFLVECGVPCERIQR